MSRQSSRPTDDGFSTTWREINEQPGDPAFGHCLQMLTKGVDGPTRLIRRGVDVRPRLFNEFDQTTLEAQPLALKRIGRLALCADLADQLDKSSRARSCGDINASEFCLKQIHFSWQKPRALGRGSVVCLPMAVQRMWIPHEVTIEFQGRRASEPTASREARSPSPPSSMAARARTFGGSTPASIARIMLRELGRVLINPVV